MGAASECGAMRCWTTANRWSVSEPSIRNLLRTPPTPSRIGPSVALSNFAADLLVCSVMSVTLGAQPRTGTFQSSGMSLARLCPHTGEVSEDARHRAIERVARLSTKHLDLAGFWAGCSEVIDPV